ncbi:hypothetical protein Cgig2_009966 [Carnegiea gigantea]|uniref:R13L1/DRL21-like LRR repeat region domain-containing protein n=1 Tax=Carnegiea gigantea TaxID=171969 RepID=A0A9Q1JJU5_9CARY|nr:hypothetical protein Cgig2_009966 [Carnegiea gigantea]
MPTCLRTLPIMDASAGWGGRLTIEDLQQVEIEEAEKANLGKNENIKDLLLRWGCDYNAENKTRVLAAALQPHSNLASLEIFNYKAKSLPQWVTEMMGYDGSPFSNLVNLKIVGSIGLEQLPISLKNLVALKELHITSCRSVILQVKYCSKMENLVADMTALINLQKVTISYCANMTCLPFKSSNLPRLEAVTLGPFSLELDMFPFPTDNHDYEDQNLNGYSKQSKTTTPTMIIKQETIIKRKLGPLVELSLLRKNMEKFGSSTRVAQELNVSAPLVTFSFAKSQVPTFKSCYGHLSQLTLLDINDCPLLKKACDKETGTEWSKIQHILDFIIS